MSLDKAKYIAAVALGVRIVSLPAVSKADRQATVNLMNVAGAELVPGWGLPDSAAIAYKVGKMSDAELRAFWLKSPRPASEDSTVDNIVPLDALWPSLVVGEERSQWWAEFKTFMGWNGELGQELSGFAEGVRGRVRGLVNAAFTPEVTGLKARVSSAGWGVAAGLALALWLGGRR